VAFQQIFLWRWWNAIGWWLIVFILLTQPTISVSIFYHHSFPRGFSAKVKFFETVASPLKTLLQGTLIVVDGIKSFSQVNSSLSFSFHCTGRLIVEKNHTGLSPLGISEIRGFVFTSDQVCPGGSTIIGLMIGTYFFHGFGIYSYIFGCITCHYCDMADTSNCLQL